MPSRPGTSPNRLRFMGTRKQPKLSISLVPIPLHRINLRTAIGQHRWRKYRRSILPKKLNCSICGAKAKESSQLHAHEEWSYRRIGRRNIAKLIKIDFQCMLCHGCNHFVLSFSLLGPERIHEPIEHYCRVNSVTFETFVRHRKQATEIWKRRSRLKWEVNYGQFANLIAEREAWKNRPRVKLRLDPSTDSEPTPYVPWPRRGRPPLFGRAMTPSELGARHRYFKTQQK